MLNRIKAMFFVLIFTISALACNAEDESADRTINEPAAAGGWTIMIWLDGDNNLEPFAMADLNELEYGLYLASQTDPDIVNKVKIIVQVDRIGTYDIYNSFFYTNSIWTDTRRYIIRPDQNVPGENTYWESQRIDNGLGEVNMGDAAELRNFVEYCHEHFPADNYALILWNHGGGLQKKKSAGLESTAGIPSKIICQDETDGNDFLYTGELTDVLTDAHSVDFLGLDACLMGMVEVAYEYRPGVSGKFGADALCFSPATEQGDGWDYSRILTRLGGADTDGDTADPENDDCYNVTDNTAFTPQVFAAVCAKEYADADSTYSDDLQTQTAVDNTKINTVKTAMDAFAAAIAQVSGYKSYIEAIRGSGSSTVTMNYFSDGSSSQWISWPFFDLYDFAKRVYNHASLNYVDEESLALMTAIKAFILYSYGGSGYTGFTNDENGLSFFFTDGDAMDASDNYYLQYQWWYTSLDTNSVMSGYYYGKIDFCEKGSINGTVENWYELIMHMYMAATGLTGSKFWPSPAY